MKSPEKGSAAPSLKGFRGSSGVERNTIFYYTFPYYKLNALRHEKNIYSFSDFFIPVSF